MRLNAFVVGASLLTVSVLAGCGGGGGTPLSRASSTTSDAMKQHSTKFTSIVCTEPSKGRFLCSAAGSGITSNFDAWCSVSFDGKGKMEPFDADTACHWPVLNKGT